MKKKVFNAKLSLKKETIATLDDGQMRNAIGGNAPRTSEYGYTEGWVDGRCVQPVDGVCESGDYSDAACDGYTDECGASVICTGTVPAYKDFQ